MTTIETTFILLVVFTTFVTLVSFSTRNFNNICNNIRQKQVEYSYGYDTNYKELKNEYDTVVKPKLSKDNMPIKKVYNPEFVLRSLSLLDQLKIIENLENTGQGPENAQE